MNHVQHYAVCSGIVAYLEVNVWCYKLPFFKHATVRFFIRYIRGRQIVDTLSLSKKIPRIESRNEFDCIISEYESLLVFDLLSVEKFDSPSHHLEERCAMFQPFKTCPNSPAEYRKHRPNAFHV